MSGTSSEKRRLDSTREELREAGLPKQPLRMAARKFGPEEHDRDSGDYMARIQELQEQLNRLQTVDRRRREQCGS
jgi:hypothetical protein